jgi:feruloyl-CoA synthase
MLESNVRKYPRKPMLRHAGMSWSFADIWDRAGRAATVMAQRGVAAGDRVALMCLNTPGFVIAMFGVWRLGAVVVPVNHKLQAPEVDYILQHGGAKLCIFDGALAPVMRNTTVRVVGLSTDSRVPEHEFFDALLDDSPAWRGAPPRSDSLAEILYTSGTTGRPKGCMFSHRSVCLAALTVAAAMSMTRDERTLIAMPLWHSSPLNNWMLGTLYMGGTTVLLREYEPHGFLKTIERERVTLYFGAPVSYLLPLQAGIAPADFDLRSVRAWIYGGGPVSTETAQRLSQAYGSECFYQVFGMTETGPAGTVLYPDEYRTRSASIGRVATPGVDLRIVGDDGRDVEAHEIGEIWLKADSSMLGYLDDPSATARAFVDGWYRTGDLARRDADGFLSIVDRRTDMIVTGGENVYSKEVEDVLLAHPDVRDAAVIGRPHADWGETVVAVLVPQSGVQLHPEELATFVGSRLAKYKVPRDYIVRDALPRTATGKLMKRLLRALP